MLRPGQEAGLQPRPEGPGPAPLPAALQHGPGAPAGHPQLLPQPRHARLRAVRPVGELGRPLALQPAGLPAVQVGPGGGVDRRGRARASLEPCIPQACSVHAVTVPTSGRPPKVKAGSRWTRPWENLRPSGSFSLQAIIFTNCQSFLTCWHLRRALSHRCIKITPQIEWLRTIQVTSPQDLGRLGLLGRAWGWAPVSREAGGSCCRAWWQPRGLRVTAGGAPFCCQQEAFVPSYAACPRGCRGPPSMAAGFPQMRAPGERRQKPQSPQGLRVPDLANKNTRLPVKFGLQINDIFSLV